MSQLPTPDLTPDPGLHAHVLGGPVEGCAECSARREAEAFAVERRAYPEIDLRDAERQPLHVHTSQTGTGYLVTCASCRTLEAARRKGLNTEITSQASDQPKRPDTWVVDDPYARTPHAFERPDLAMAYAASVSRADRPTIVTDPDGVQVLVLRVDARVTVQAVRNLTGPATRPTLPPEPAEASVQALAGARLFYALYHDADAVKWLLGHGVQHRDGGKVTAFVKAYRSATAAFIPDTDRGGQSDAEHVDPIAFEEVPVDVAMRLVAQGRREAAEAIRQQARMFIGDRVVAEGEPGTMLSFNVAAQLAEGTTGVKAGGQ